MYNFKLGVERVGWGGRILLCCELRHPVTAGGMRGKCPCTVLLKWHRRCGETVILDHLNLFLTTF